MYHHLLHDMHASTCTRRKFTKRCVSLRRLAILSTTNQDDFHVGRTLVRLWPQCYPENISADIDWTGFALFNVGTQQVLFVIFCTTLQQGKWLMETDNMYCTSTVFGLNTRVFTPKLCGNTRPDALQRNIWWLKKSSDSFSQGSAYTNRK